MKNASTFIRSLYSPGFASIMMWFFGADLTLGFRPWVRVDHRRFDQYDRDRFISTTINYEKAAALFLSANRIIDGNQIEQMELLIPCNKQATLLFEHKPDQNGQMRTWLTIEKSGERITFQFQIFIAKVRVNGKVEDRVIHVGLGAFAKTLEGYLTAIGASNHLNKLTEAELGDPQAGIPTYGQIANRYDTTPMMYR